MLECIQLLIIINCCVLVFVFLILGGLIIHCWFDFISFIYTLRNNAYFFIFTLFYCFIAVFLFFYYLSSYAILDFHATNCFMVFKCIILEIFAIIKSTVLLIIFDNKTWLPYWDVAVLRRATTHLGLLILIFFYFLYSQIFIFALFFLNIQQLHLNTRRNIICNYFKFLSYIHNKITSYSARFGGDIQVDRLFFGIMLLCVCNIVLFAGLHSFVIYMMTHHIILKYIAFWLTLNYINSLIFLIKYTYMIPTKKNICFFCIDIILCFFFYIIY